jgi:hypothetical protein
VPILIKMNNPTDGTWHDSELAKMLREFRKEMMDNETNKR